MEAFFIFVKIPIGPKIALCIINEGIILSPNECHVVVVDDEVDLANILCESLEMEDFKVSEFHSAEEALNNLGTDNFSVVISDAHMPGKSGLELLKILKETYSHPFLFYLCTGDMEISESHLKELGGTCLITKPYNLFDLIDVIKDRIANDS